MIEEGIVMNYLNEPVYYRLSAKTKDFSRILETLKEEFDNIDRNQQKLDITENESIKRIYQHNRDKAIEEVCMTMEWLRRNVLGWDESMHKYIFSSGKIDDPERSFDSEKQKSSVNIYW